MALSSERAIFYIVVFDKSYIIASIASIASRNSAPTISTLE
jgi:hypothetical protein